MLLCRDSEKLLPVPVMLCTVDQPEPLPACVAHASVSVPSRLATAFESTPPLSTRLVPVALFDRPDQCPFPDQPHRRQQQ